MANPLSSEPGTRAWRTVFRRSLCTCAVSLACLLAVLPAARADEEDGPVPPDRVLWGLVLFFLVFTWALALCLRAPRKARLPRALPRRNRPLPLWLRRWLLWDFPTARKRPPNGASRQVRRAILRRRR